MVYCSLYYPRSKHLCGRSSREEPTSRRLVLTRIIDIGSQSPPFSRAFFSPAFKKYFSTFRMAALRLSPLRLASKSTSTSVTAKRAAFHQTRALSSPPSSHRIGLCSSSSLLKSELIAGSSPLHHSSSPMSNYSSASATARLSTIARHLKSSSDLPLNTPYSSAQRAIQAPAGPQQSLDGSSFSTKTPTKPQNPMSSQAPHAAVLIPGPIEYDDAVLQSMSHYR